MDTFLVTTCAVIGAFFKVSRILDIFSTVNSAETHRFLTGIDEWAKTGGYKVAENFDPVKHERNQEGFPKVKKGTRIMEITQLTDFLRHVVEIWYTSLAGKPFAVPAEERECMSAMSETSHNMVTELVAN